MTDLTNLIPVAPILWLCRIGLCLAFVYSGIAKLFDFKSAVAEEKQFGMPAPVLFAAVTVATQLGGPALMFFTRGWPAALGAVLLAGFTLLATFIGHPFWREAGKARFDDRNSFVEHFGIIAGLVLMALIELKPLPA